MSTPVAAFLFGGPRHRERVEIQSYKDGRVPLKIVVPGEVEDLVYIRDGRVKEGYADFMFNRTIPKVEPVVKNGPRPRRSKIQRESGPLKSRQMKRVVTDGTNAGLSCSCCWDGSPCEGVGI